MKIVIDEGKPIMIAATYETELGFDVSELNIDWAKVESIWCKYTTLYIEMGDGTIHELDSYGDGETDYKWPVQLKLLDDDYKVLWEEN